MPYGVFIPQRGVTGRKIVSLLNGENTVWSLSMGDDPDQIILEMDCEATTEQWAASLEGCRRILGSPIESILALVQDGKELYVVEPRTNYLKMTDSLAGLI